MTEDEAKAWVEERFGSNAADAMAHFTEIVLGETRQQNLIAPSTIDSIWARHIVDSAQLLGFVSASDTGRWLDIGSGAGFPGIVVAALTEREVWLVEPRKRRATFLAETASRLGIGARTHIVCDKIEKVATIASIISARAVGPLTELFAWARNCSTPETRWIMPKGRSARDEVATAQQDWQGVFHVEHSLTDPESLIVLATGVSRR